MTRDKVFFVLGTRPEAIKLAPVIRQILSSQRVDPVVINTGQHREMAGDFLKIFRITARHNCRVMRPGQSLSQLTARIMNRLDSLFLEEKPRLTVVQGDTTSALCGALASFYHQVPVAHVEAGLRTRDPANPFPEEINRALVARLAAEHFAPTELARRNLLAEGIPGERITVTGNTVVDALHVILNQRLPIHHPQVRELIQSAGHHHIVMVTAHRRENWERGIRDIALALRELAARFSQTRFVFALHPNPLLQKQVNSILAGIPGVILVDSLEYPDFIKLLAASTLVISDSGGIQEEAPSLGVPVLITRQQTERPEVVEAGWGILVGTDQATIVREADRVLSRTDQPRPAEGLFGDGLASQRIVHRITHLLGLEPPGG